MARNIFLVDAYQVNGQGAYAHINGYPKVFDSNDYDNDINIALKRANGSFASTWSGFCSVDNKQIQVVTLMDIFGNQIDRRCIGGFPAETPAEQVAQTEEYSE